MIIDHPLTGTSPTATTTLQSGVGVPTTNSAVSERTDRTQTSLSVCNDCLISRMADVGLVYRRHCSDCSLPLNVRHNYIRLSSVADRAFLVVAAAAVVDGGLTWLPSRVRRDISTAFLGSSVRTFSDRDICVIQWVPGVDPLDDYVAPDLALTSFVSSVSLTMAFSND